jgi:hypothetical protein
VRPLRSRPELLKGPPRIERSVCGRGALVAQGEAGHVLEQEGPGGGRRERERLDAHDDVGGLLLAPAKPALRLTRTRRRALS